jgi:hypothetical protein
VNPNIKNIVTTVDHQFSDDKSPYIQAFRFVSSIVGNSSCIGLIPRDKCIAVFVGILGQYIGLVDFPCDTSKIPNNGIHNWGTFICLQEKRPIISSWSRMVSRIGDIIKSNKRLKTDNNGR